MSINDDCIDLLREINSLEGLGEFMDWAIAENIQVKLDLDDPSNNEVLGEFFKAVARAEGASEIT